MVGQVWNPPLRAGRACLHRDRRRPCHAGNVVLLFVVVGFTPAAPSSIRRSRIPGAGEGPPGSRVDVEVGEVYCVLRDNGGFDVEARHSDVEVDCSIILESEIWNDSGHTTSSPLSSQEIYKLPLSVQRLWRED